ncbi:low-density lipoprotein receptor-related protein [Plakobranchus ocellatus]|uniref:Low-density lipoprotein receptor-related protein n=1 Tax=Plakobranchus ocellatus TaxID=259542 RepID=A0AAV4A4D1_9GAST|nr:low-density lipoprotein receptor-related protein [Plakobranchus ocellatus]
MSHAERLMIKRILSTLSDARYSLEDIPDGVHIPEDCYLQDAFLCNVGDQPIQCVSSSLTCDQVADCKNGWDESVKICGCLPHEFQCNSSHCIDLVKRCDRTLDCQDGEDEEDCEDALPGGIDGIVASESALRSAGSLLSWVRAPPPVPWPDGGPESQGDSGEFDITTKDLGKSHRRMPRETFECLTTHSKCANHKCVPRAKVCDFVDDCGDNSDETCRRSGGSSGRAIGYHVRCPRLEYESGPRLFNISPQCPLNMKWMIRLFFLKPSKLKVATESSGNLPQNAVC